ncbi:uncharacterized protein LOC107465354 [Arachis duranensis]|uniref:Uncharacterized protein LOC107465354 n=1 Tax=Arachis duranensis TaxID=130453 RepID=A0A6P4C1I4_ARADU|nr:uncharacterized protein LOC107465354 [Arachis duranensis]
MDDPLLISYFYGGLCARKRFPDASSGCSLVKYKTADEAWRLINDVVEATQHARVRNNSPKSAGEVFSSDSALTKNIHDEEVVVVAQEVDDEEETRQEEEELNFKEPMRKVVMDESIPIPFSSMVKKAKKTLEFDLNMLQIFKKVEVTIPLLNVIQQISKYAKFLKDLCTHKDRIGELKTLSLGSFISSLMNSIPEECSDPGPCLVSCWIGGVTFYDCMCDLGACVSIMPLLVFVRLNLVSLKRSATKFLLADKSVIIVARITEDVLVRIKNLVFSVDFYILEMSPIDNGKPSSILLGRPFLKTSKFKLDAFIGTYSFEVGDKIIKFNLEEAMRHPPERLVVQPCQEEA